MPGINADRPILIDFWATSTIQNLSTAWSELGTSFNGVADSIDTSDIVLNLADGGRFVLHRDATNLKITVGLHAS